MNGLSDYSHLNHFLVFALFVTNMYLPSFALPTHGWTEESLAESDYDQCYYQSTGAGNFAKLNYGQCMNMAGPVGCCLEGHYKPGICPNLGHLCCTKPDPDCSHLRNNKDITRQMIKQRREYFKKFVRQNSPESSDSNVRDQAGSHHRPPRSSNRPIRVNFEIVEMPAHIQLDAVSFVSEALEQHKGDQDQAAYHLCKMLDQKYPDQSNWACVVGNKFDYSIEASAGKYMLFYIGNTHRIQVMAFVPKTSAESR